MAEDNSDVEILPPEKQELLTRSQKVRAFFKDFVSDPAINFVVISDPLIFMTPKALGVEDMPHADMMHDVVGIQALAGVFTRAVASYMHVNNPDHEHMQFMQNLPLRVAGYTHLGMGAFLAAAGQPREAAIALPLGLGNLQLTGDFQYAMGKLNQGAKAVKSKILGAPENIEALELGEDNREINPVMALRNAYKSPNANFALANFAILLPAMAVFSEAVAQGGVSADIAIKALPVIPLSVATYFIGKNVINDQKDTNEKQMVFNNEGYPTMLVGATAGVGGAVGLSSLSAKGSLMSAFQDLGGAISHSAHMAVDKVVSVVTLNADKVSETTNAVYQAANAQDAYVAAASLASITIAFAYAGLENKFGTFFKPDRPTKTVIPLEGPEGAG